MSTRPEQGGLSTARSPADPDERKRRARERKRRYRSGKRRIDFYPDERAERVLAVLLTPPAAGWDTSSILNAIISEWAGGIGSAGGSGADRKE